MQVIFFIFAFAQIFGTATLESLPTHRQVLFHFQKTIVILRRGFPAIDHHNLRFARRKGG